MINDQNLEYELSLQSDIAKVDLLYSKFTNYCFLQEEERRKTKELLEEEERRKEHFLQVNNYVEELQLCVVDQM